MPHAATALNSLPVELQLLVLRFISPLSLHALSRVSRHWNDLTQPEFLRRFTIQSDHDLTSSMERHIYRGRAITRLFESNQPAKLKEVLTILDHSYNLNNPPLEDKRFRPDTYRHGSTYAHHAILAALHNGVECLNILLTHNVLSPHVLLPSAIALSPPDEFTYGINNGADMAPQHEDEFIDNHPLRFLLSIFSYWAARTWLIDRWPYACHDPEGDTTALKYIAVNANPGSLLAVRELKMVVDAIRNPDTRELEPWADSAIWVALLIARKRAGHFPHIRPRLVEYLETICNLDAPREPEDPSDPYEEEYWKAAKHAGIENDGHANRLAGTMTKLAKANQLIRPDGWSLVLRKVHLASGNPKDRLYLVHPTEEQGEFSLARWEKRWDAWKKTARPGATGPETAAP